ncbi:MAG: hypothetical protein ACRD6N_06345 [Pyrinomonadaceae bacterium]
MKNVFSKAMLLLTVGAAIFASSASAQERSEAPLTNTAIVKLVRAGFKEKTVIAIIRSRPNKFDLAPERLIELKRNGVSENIILNMLALDGSQLVDEDGWGDDEAFFRSKGATRPKSGTSDSGGGMDIFGSGGGSSSQTRSRGGRVSGQGETTTSGSATVRILRPPSEAGGTQLKLEKTPTLNNDSIVTLVEAGFSEGTIIKRIEDSPADFDMSPAKLQELRKRRVSEAIIAAMTAAMDDGSKPAAANPGTEN